MKNKYLFGIILVLIVIISIIFFYIQKTYYQDIEHPTRNVNTSDVGIIQLIKNKYVDLIDYPSDGLPTKTIKSEFKDNIWYIGFIIEGSGVPVIAARCFSVASDNIIVEKEFVRPSRMTDISFSPQTCSTIDYQY